MMTMMTCAALAILIPAYLFVVTLAYEEARDGNGSGIALAGIALALICLGMVIGCTAEALL